MTIDYHADSIVVDEEYDTMSNFVNALGEIAARTAPYHLADEEFEIDRMTNKFTADRISSAVLAFYEIESDAMSAWITENREVAHWVSALGSSLSPSNFPELESFIDDFEDE